MTLFNPNRAGTLRTLLQKSAAALVLCGAMGVQTAQAQAEEIQLSFITGFTFSGEMGDVIMRGVKSFVEEFNERAEGKAQINVIGGPEIVPPFDQLKALQTGQFDMMSSTSLWFRETLSMNFINYLPGEDQVALMQDGGRELLQGVVEDSAGVSFVMLSFPGIPFYIWSREEIATLEDAQNVKVRAFPGVSDRLADNLGMLPTNVPVSDVYSSLRSGVLDAAVRDIVAVGVSGEVEFVPHYTDARICWCNGMVFVATPVWDGLPDDVKELMFEVAAETEQETLTYLTQVSADNAKSFEEQFGATQTETSPELRQILGVQIPAANVRTSLENVSNRDEIIAHFGLEALLEN